VTVAAAVEWMTHAASDAWCPPPLVAAFDAAFVLGASAEPALLSVAHAGWRVCGASVRGRAHAHRSEHREDALACAGDDELLVCAVADGAGSSALSRIGAAVVAQMSVVNTVSRFRDGRGDGSLVTQLGTAIAFAVHDAALRLHELATLSGESPNAFRSTLVLAAIIGDVLLVSQVGDGAALVQRTDGTVVRIGAQRSTAWAGEVQCFVPDACAMTAAASIRQVNAANVAVLALMTDGVDDPFHPLEQSGDALMSQWRVGTNAPIGTVRQAQIGSVIASTDALAEWLRFEQRGEVDDRTLMLVHRAPVTLT
jgi:Protein phosphatase 2C